ncbi:MAG: hypothetical protein ORN29_00610 [Rhodoferax sp.]|nr:hypothetical protein [Rhodoferax sp.]
MKTPSEDLTDVIALLLVKEKLFLQEDAAKCKAKIAAGGMEQGDWLLAVEKAFDKEWSQ